MSLRADDEPEPGRHGRHEHGLDTLRVRSIEGIANSKDPAQGTHELAFRVGKRGVHRVGVFGLGAAVVSGNDGDQLELLTSETGEPTRRDHDVAVFVVLAVGDGAPDVVEDGGQVEQGARTRACPERRRAAEGGAVDRRNLVVDREGERGDMTGVRLVEPGRESEGPRGDGGVGRIEGGRRRVT